MGLLLSPQFLSGFSAVSRYLLPAGACVGYTLA